MDFNDELLKVPLQVSWLAENGMLVKAARLLGYRFELAGGLIKTATPEGCKALVEAGPVKTTAGTRKQLQEVDLGWDDCMLFTLGQLHALGFDLGDATEIWHALQYPGGED